VRIMHGRHDRAGTVHAEETLLSALQRVRKHATPNDLVVVLDSSHQLVSDSAISQLNSKFVDTKCWLVHGAYQAMSHNVMRTVQARYDDAVSLVAGTDSIWTFKAFLIDHLTDADFPGAEQLVHSARSVAAQDADSPASASSISSETVQPHGRAQRMHFLLHFLDLAGAARVQYMPTPLHLVTAQVQVG
jgi:hypothetical protein